jgi:hypothetical protein
MKLKNVKFNLLESFFYFLSLVAFILAIVAMAGSWRVFSGRGKTLSIGLWQICAGGSCNYSWANSGYSYYGTGYPVTYGTYIYYDFTPAEVAVAQAFYIIGVINHIFISCCAVTGLSSVIFGSLLAAIWYTIAYSCAMSFFLGIKGVPADITMSNGYAGVCATVSFGFQFSV